jgi:hypothetical protein
MNEVVIGQFEVFYLDVNTGYMDSRVYHAEDEQHALELFRDFHSDDLVDSVEYRGEAGI